MSDILRREMAPVTAAAWAEIDAEAARILKGNLSGRAVADVNGPHGWTLASVNLGGMDVGKAGPVKGVEWGLRQVLPLTEIRVPFTLGMWDLDNISRGGKTPELKAVAEAAQAAALFEEKAVYAGFKQAGIAGMLGGGRPAVTMPAKAGAFAAAVEEAIHAIQSAGIGGPYDLVLGRTLYQMLAVGDEKGYPLQRRVREMLGGAIRWSPALGGGLVASVRGGDFELTLGQDFSVGYQGHDARNVSLYIAESFTFRVLEPAAAVEIKAKA